MYVKVKDLLIFFVISIASRGQCFKNGYSKDTCDSLTPNQEKGEPNVTVSNSGVPFKTSTKSEKYRRNRALEIFINGENIEGFQLQIRLKDTGRGSKPKRIGEFVELPADAQPLQCDDGKSTSVTHKSLNPKSNLEFKWHAPDEDEGQLKLYDAFVSSDGLYWADVCDITLDCADLPVSVKDCGEGKSCVRYSADKNDCDGNTCTYLLTYQTGDNGIEFSLGTLSDVENSYSAVGFSETKDGKIDITACMRENNKISVKHYTLEAEGESPVAGTANLQNIKTDKEDSNFWCEFTRPIEDAGAEPLDFDKDLYWIYTWGQVNDTSHEPILGSKNWHRSRHNIKHAINERSYTGGSTSISVTGFMLASLLSLLLLFIPQI